MNQPKIRKRMLELLEQALSHLNNNKIPPVSLVQEITKLKLKLK